MSSTNPAIRVHRIFTRWTAAEALDVLPNDGRSHRLAGLRVRVWRAGEGRRYELHGAYVVPMDAADLYDPFEAAEVIAGRADTSPAEAQPESIGGAGGRLPYVPTGCFGAEWAVEDRGYYLADRLERLTAARGAAVRR